MDPSGYKIAVAALCFVDCGYTLQKSHGVIHLENGWDLLPRDSAFVLADALEEVRLTRKLTRKGPTIGKAWNESVMSTFIVSTFLFASVQ